MDGNILQCLMSSSWKNLTEHSCLSVTFSTTLITNTNTIPYMLFSSLVYSIYLQHKLQTVKLLKCIGKGNNYLCEYSFLSIQSFILGPPSLLLSHSLGFRDYEMNLTEIAPFFSLLYPIKTFFSYVALPRDAIAIYKSFEFPNISCHSQKESRSHRLNLKRIGFCYQGQSGSVFSFC